MLLYVLQYSSKEEEKALQQRSHSAKHPKCIFACSVKQIRVRARAGANQNVFLQRTNEKRTWSSQLRRENASAQQPESDLLSRSNVIAVKHITSARRGEPLLEDFLRNPTSRAPLFHAFVDMAIDLRVQGMSYVLFSTDG